MNFRLFYKRFFLYEKMYLLLYFITFLKINFKLYINKYLYFVYVIYQITYGINQLIIINYMKYKK